MTEALNLADYQADPRPMVAGVAKALREESVFMDILPFPTMGALGISILQEGTLPTAMAWRDPGSDHGSYKAGRPIEKQESAYSIGNEIIVDKTLMKDTRPKLYDPAVYQTKMVAKAIARTFNEKCILGEPEDLKNPVGLYHRIWNDLGSDQRINVNLDISPDASTLSANALKFFDALDSALYALNGRIKEDNGDIYFLTNDTVIQRFSSICRISGLLDQTKDALGRTFTSYKGAKFVDMGFKLDDSTRIMGNVENANGYTLSGGACSSIFGVRLGNEFFTGWQEYGLEVSDFELQSNKVTYKSVVDWVVGISVGHPRYSVAQMYNITAA